VKKLKRDTYVKESVTFISSRSLLGRGDLRGTLGHQSKTLRGARADLSYRLLQDFKHPVAGRGRLEGMGIR
jgi:hypothetical protein